MSSTVPMVGSPRGTRPRNRRDQIRTAAVTLFYERGYEQVSVADVAGSVNVGPSALYRHFSGKADLLFEAVDQTITAFGAMVADLPARDLDGIARTAARTALAYRPLGVLWQREARNLPVEQREVLRKHLRAAVLTLAGTLRELRPELDAEQAEFLASAGVNAMSSISFHRLALPDPEFEQVLADLALRVLTHRFDSADAAAGPLHARPAAVSRRDEIADTAAALFARHGYEGVSLDDIGVAVGMAGPSLYNHFASKQDLLLAAVDRGYMLLRGTLDDAMSGSGPTAVVLRRVSDSFVDLTHDHGDLVTLLIAEARALGPEHPDLARRVQQDYVDRWVALLHDLRPAEDPMVSG